MADTLTRVFRTFASQDQVRKELTETPSIYSTLLVGEQNISRSLLLLTAVTAASQLGVKAVFFTQTYIQQLPLFLQKRAPILNPESLKKIKFCYPRTFEELLQQVAGLHESSTLPSLIIIDRLEAYLCDSGGSEQVGSHPQHLSCAAHLSALLCDTMVFLTQDSCSSAPCQLIASYLSKEDTGQAGGQMRDTNSVLDVLDRFFQCRCTLTRDDSYEVEAAVLQEEWRICILGTTDFNAGNCEGRKSVDQEWKLLIFCDGLIEFKMV